MLRALRRCAVLGHEMRQCGRTQMHLHRAPLCIVRANSTCNTTSHRPDDMRTMCHPPALHSVPSLCAQASQPAWDKYMRLAQGDKVLDNPQLLRKALKKDGKVKAKKASAWQARNQATAERQQARQNKCATASLVLCVTGAGAWLPTHTEPGMVC